MEEKKLDINSIIGFVLIFGILMYMLWQNQPTPEELEAQAKAKQEQISTEAKTSTNQDVLETTSEDFSAGAVLDSTQLVGLKNKLGAFAYASTLPSASAQETLVENDVLSLKFSNKGGYLTEVKLKNFVNYDSIPIYLIKDNNASFNINFGTTDSRILNTKDLYFEPTITKNAENTIVSMKLKVSESKFLEYRYEIKKDDYMLDFDIRSQGLSDVINSSQAINLDWKVKTYRHAKSVSYENRYTELVFEYEDGKDDYLGQSELSDDTASEVTYVAYKQHFFTSILLANSPFKTAQLKSENLVKDEEIDTVFTKAFTAKLPLELTSGEINKSMNWYFGPSDYKILNAYNRNLDEVVPLGWGIFGWINRYVFIPTFGFLSGFLPYGFAIIVMTILVRIVMSPVTYKSYVSQAKMKVLKPEITEISEKYKDNAMKKQQETMALYSKAGASPMAGCLPALLQLPVFYALFQFFPSAFDLRQKSFLWAEDLSSYDTIAKLPFHIPFYGDHVSLFPILASVAIFFYMQMTTGQQMASQPTQEGMPDMSKMMKYMMYFSPIMMLFFFNNYASGLSLYYFVSNLITIGIMLVIKNFIIDEDKIHARIQENKKKPKKENRFQKKMKEMMEQAEKQKQTQKRK
ncbi:MAG: membrane protein insertase YidC [Flavobacteriales bacterium]|nr:membrane protein insertase YidC [Flavobacteriia bacterium]NCP05136.1 membrane protein insertase YidC [Flavobacteriales bacterium]PIV93310.1 MAG: membrane protein insertase YidC [Flavobacteriaceae bacterium CG17_big_fil_post_rev_8_21_14_2_50_33_15]PIY10363.1 MAG: membrane protein insertase YidC [Flavobacteriaceae bacterium CG_4_10_14_3_um_filter_33_47]PJB20384.1 MAG: membrane protein insertase YidC [Flavobacteriaceae bacterium CG_4_9_14_3_um_filter_33_16]